MTRAGRTSLTVGCLLFLGSTPLLLFLFGMSTLAGGLSAEGRWMWWAAMLEAIFRSRSAWVSWTLLIWFVVGVFLIGRGLWQAFGGLRITIGRMMVAVLVVAVGLAFTSFGVLMAVLAPVLLTLVALVREPVFAPDRRMHDERS